MESTIKEKPFLVKFKNEVYDITEFVHKHPGGRSTLKGLENADMTPRFNKAPPHSDAAIYLMKEYKLKNFENGNYLVNGLHHDGPKIKKRSHQEDKIEDVVENFNESMEHLVDWSKAMLPQIGDIGEFYSEWVNKPVDRPLRLFSHSWLEILTKTPWWAVPLFWIPAITYLIIRGSNDALSAGNSLTAIYLYILEGILLWSLTEYSLHRWVFHLDTTNSGVVTTTFHFLLHGLHHKVPFDPYRLVFPPFPAFLIASFLYQPIYYLFTCPLLILAGGLIGYVCYDMIHFYLHYGSPSGGHLYHMKRYHYQHHFVHHDKGFGISSQMWDHVFGTKIFLRKLKYLLKW